jgi:chromate transporter
VTEGAVDEVAAVPPLGAIFAAFLKMGLLGFGGVLPWARRILVDERAWLTDHEFAELLGMCQILPGPNVVNLSVILGARWRGPGGALVAMTGILFIPTLVVVALAAFYAAVAQTPVARAAITAASAAAAGLIIGTALRLLRSARLPPRGLAVGALVFAAVGVLKAPLLWVLAIAVPAAIGLEWYRSQ